MKKIKLKDVIEKEFNKSFRYRTKGAITKVKKSVGWTFDIYFCYCKGAAKCQNLITSRIIPLGVMYLLVITLDQYKVSVEHHWT